MAKGMNVATPNVDSPIELEQLKVIYFQFVPNGKLIIFRYPKIQEQSSIFVQPIPFKVLNYPISPQQEFQGTRVSCIG